MYVIWLRGYDGVLILREATITDAHVGRVLS